MIDFTKLYAATILKDIVRKIERDMKSSKRAAIRKFENSEDGFSVRTQRHWKAAADIEFYYSEIQEGYKRMRELDRQTNWSDNLHQDRFKFMGKHEDVLKEYKSKYGVKE